MSDDHDLDCSVKDDEQTDGNDDQVVENGGSDVVEVEETSANASKDETSAIDKETLSSEVDEKGDLYGAKATINWTLVEGREFKVSWNLPEGTATPEDYVALYCTGK